MICGYECLVRCKCDLGIVNFKIYRPMDALVILSMIYVAD